MTIKRYDDSYFDEVWNLHVLALGAVGALAADEFYQDMRNIEQVYLNNNGEFLVGLVDGRVVAMGGLKRTSEDRAEVKRMRVHPDFQGQGYGQAILIKLEHRAKELGYRTLHLDTSFKQEAAQKLYEKNGFYEVGRDIVVGFDCILYEKEIR